jgi:hypothetical protein
MQNVVQTTRAYIASAGTAVVMLGASLCMFVIVSAFVAFGSWPGAQSHSSVDQVVLRDVAAPRPKTVAVRADAVAVARRAAASRSVAQRKAASRATPRSPSAKGPAGTTAPSTSPATPLTPSAPSPSPGTAPAPGAQLQAPVQQQAGDVKQQIDTTAGDVTTQVEQQTQTVQTQVNEVVDQVNSVVDQVTGGPQPPPAGNALDGVKNAAGSLLGG